MVRLSDERLAQPILRRISDLLIAHIVRVKTKQQAHKLISELLSPPERIMLAKRFAIITMLHRNHTTAEIEQTLHVSRTTIGAIEERMERGEYEATIAELKRASRGDLAVALETLVEFSLFKGGKEKWKHTNRAADAHYRHIPKAKSKTQQRRSAK